MLPKKERISKKEFTRVFKHSKTISRGSFFVLKRLEDVAFSASAVVSKKVSKKAHERNYIKRIVYALLKTAIKPRVSNGAFICIIQKNPLQYKELLNDFKKNFYTS